MSYIVLERYGVNSDRYSRYDRTSITVSYDPDTSSVNEAVIAVSAVMATADRSHYATVVRLWFFQHHWGYKSPRYLIVRSLTIVNNSWKLRMILCTRRHHHVDDLESGYGVSSLNPTESKHIVPVFFETRLWLSVYLLYWPPFLFHLALNLKIM